LQVEKPHNNHVTTSPCHHLKLRYICKKLKDEPTP